jgi:cytochrome b561
VTLTKDRTGYSATQIVLHWLVAALVVFQLFFGESMGHVMRAERRGTVPDPTDVTLAGLHYWIGLAILALVGVRLLARWRFGAPEAASEAPNWAVQAARLSHALFYVLLAAAPVTGLLAYYFRYPYGDIHELAKPVFIVLIGIHAAAALWHEFWLKDGTLRRMVLPAS